DCAGKAATGKVIGGRKTCLTGSDDRDSCMEIHNSQPTRHVVDVPHTWCGLTGSRESCLQRPFLLDGRCWFYLVKVYNFEFHQRCASCYWLTACRHMGRLALRAPRLKIFFSLPFGDDEVTIFTLGWAQHLKTLEARCVINGVLACSEASFEFWPLSFRDFNGVDFDDRHRHIPS